jgi:hypothetical protein
VAADSLDVGLVAAVASRLLALPIRDRSHIVKPVADAWELLRPRVVAIDDGAIGRKPWLRIVERDGDGIGGRRHEKGPKECGAHFLLALLSPSYVEAGAHQGGGRMR